MTATPEALSAPDAPGAANLRPEPPIQVSRLVLPLVALVVAYGVAGIFGSQGVVWGLLIGGATAAFLWWQRIVKDIPDLLVVVAAGVVSMMIFNAVLRGRTTVISWPLSLRASLGWTLFGVVVGAVVARSTRPRLRPVGMAGRALATGLAFGVAAFLALQMGTVVGYIPELRSREIAAGAIQFVSTSFFVHVGLIVAAVGGSAALSLRAGNGALFGGAAGAVMTVFAANQIEFSVSEILSSFTRVGALAGEFWPPDWSWPKTIGQPEAIHIVQPFIETLQIAVIGATIGCVLAVPLAFSASRPTAPNYPSYWVAKSFMNVVRTIPDLFWGILFATAVGFGSPFAGALAMIMFSLSIMSKLLSETVDAIDLGPLEAAKSSGSRHWQMVQYAAYPQVAPNYVAYALYIFELNIRASVVLGLVGAGGIGRLLDERRSFFQWDQVMAIVMVIFAAVILIELFSIWVRKKLV